MAIKVNALAKRLQAAAQAEADQMEQNQRNIVVEPIEPEEEPVEPESTESVIEETVQEDIPAEDESESDDFSSSAE
jgi:hypothetical protein